MDGDGGRAVSGQTRQQNEADGRTYIRHQSSSPVAFALCVVIIVVAINIGLNLLGQCCSDNVQRPPSLPVS